MRTYSILFIASFFFVASFGAEQITLAEATDLNGPIVQIEPGKEGQDLAKLATQPKTRIVQEPSYWIGVRGRSVESEVLRTHLQLAEDMGVVVEQVISDSPAGKAGLQKHDIILRANGDAVDNMSVLQTHVREHGEKPIELKIIRYGKQEKIVVVPELLPEEFAAQTSPDVDRWGPMGRNPQDLLDQLLRGEGRLNAQRLFGQGFNFQPFDLNAMPSGVSVSIQRQNDGPPKIIVKKGDQTWNLVGDDEEALLQLPDDVRPFVEQMLRGQGNNLQGEAFDLNADLLQQRLPRRLGALGEEADGALAERIREMERKLQDLQQRLEADPAVK